MKYLLLLLVFPCVATTTCLRFLSPKDSKGLIHKPGHILFWNANTSEFDKLEALIMNNMAFCSIDVVNDLRGKTLTVAIDTTYFQKPFIMENVNKTGVTGLIGDIWMNLEDVLGFKTIYRRVSRKKKQDKTELLMNGTHALLIVSAMYRHSTCHYDYSLPFTTNSYALFVRSEGEEASRTWYLDTFSSDLWLTAFIFTLCIACSFMGTYYIKKLICANYTEFHDELSSPLFSLLYVLAGITGQGFQKIPKSWSLRLIILSCLILGLLLSCGFSSTLTSDLANRRFSIPFTSLEEMAMKKTHTLCVRNDSSAYIHFTVNETADSEIQDDWKGLVNNGCPDMKADLIPELCDPGFVYLEAPNIFRSLYKSSRRNCNFIQLPKTYWSRRLAFLQSRSAQHRHLINMYILRMGTAGILNYLERKWMSMDISDKSKYLTQRNFQPVEYEHINSAFYGFFMMVVVSVFICILENVWYKLNHKKINSTLILPGTRDYTSVKMTKVYRKSRPRTTIRRCPTVKSMLPEIMKDPEFLQNVTIRTSRW